MDVGWVNPWVGLDFGLGLDFPSWMINYVLISWYLVSGCLGSQNFIKPMGWVWLSLKKWPTSISALCPYYTEVLFMNCTSGQYMVQFMNSPGTVLSLYPVRSSVPSSVPSLYRVFSWVLSGVCPEFGTEFETYYMDEHVRSLSWVLYLVLYLVLYRVCPEF
jgi:hypothetical protein